MHFTGGVRITLAPPSVTPPRAIAQTRMTIIQRGPVDGVLCDVACTGRFYDFFEKRGVGPAATGGQASSVVPPEPAQRGVSGVVPPEPAQRDGRWGIVLRQPIYEKDRLDPVDPGASLALDPAALARFPEGYRYLAYLQVQAGYPVKPDMPGLTGPEVERLYERGAAWLAGQPVAP